MLIMLVENNIDKLRNLQRYVSECYMDSDIMPFSDSSDAMQFIQSERFSVDLCFTAVVMRGVSGFELTAESSITQVTTAEAFMQRITLCLKRTAAQYRKTVQLRTAVAFICGRQSQNWTNVSCRRTRQKTAAQFIPIIALLKIIHRLLWITQKY